jgi:hypothetical protein
MRFFSVLFTGVAALSLCLSSLAQASPGQTSQTQTTPAQSSPAPATQAQPADTPAQPAAQAPVPQLKLEDLPPDPHTPTPEEIAEQQAAQQRAQIVRVASAQANWGPRASTKGITLTMKETGRTKAVAGTIITYRLATTGFAPGTRLVLLRWPLNQNVTPLMDGIALDASGTAICAGPAAPAAATAPSSPNAPGTSAPGTADQGTSAPGTSTDANAAAAASGSTSGSAQETASGPATAPRPTGPASCVATMKVGDPIEVTTTAAKGEAIRLALVSEDRKTGGATSAIPFPVEGKDKGCTLQVLLGSKDAELVLIEGDGFTPSAPFTMGAETFGEKTSITAKPDAQGHLVAAMTPYIPGHDSGDTVVYYQSDPCTPTLSFHWGKGNYKAE